MFELVVKIWHHDILRRGRHYVEYGSIWNGVSG